MTSSSKSALDLGGRVFCTSHVLCEEDRGGGGLLPADSQLDQLVYKLYGLTDEEIKIVEGG